MALAVLGAVVLIVAIIALQGPGNHSVTAGSRLPSGSAGPSGSTSSGSTSPSSGASSSGRASTSSATGPTAAREPLVVLNNTTVTGLAKQAAATFTSGGWTVTQYSNYSNDILSTCAYYDPAVVGAKAAAEALRKQFPAIQRVEPQFTELASWHSPIVVILTPDWTSN